GGGEGGVLAEAVAGAEAGLDAEPLDGVEHHQAGDERGELGVARVAQLLGVGVEEELADVPAGHVARLLDELPALVVHPRSPHAGALRPLTGEGECEHRFEARPIPRQSSRYPRVTVFLRVRPTAKARSAAPSAARHL